MDAEAGREAIETIGQFNIIHPGYGLKIDVYVNPDTPYDRARPARRQKLPVAPGVDVYFARPEDVIVYKLLSAGTDPRRPAYGSTISPRRGRHRWGGIS